MNASAPSAGRRRALSRLLALGLAAGSAPGWAARADASAASPPLRRALVVGCGSYPGAPLQNALADARLMAETLRMLGFEVVAVEDPGRERLLRALGDWLTAAEPAAVRMVYYSGHGAQYRGRNYLVPVDAQLVSEDDLPAKAVDANDLSERVARFDGGVNLLVFDACRAVPVRTPAGQRPRALSEHNGLAGVVAPRGTIVAYATAPDRLALDAGRNGHSPFTWHLAREMRVPGVPVEQMLKRVRLAVMRDTENRQVPWDSSSLVGDFCLADNGAGNCVPAVVPGTPVDLRHY